MRGCVLSESWERVGESELVRASCVVGGGHGEGGHERDAEEMMLWREWREVQSVADD